MLRLLLSCLDGISKKGRENFPVLCSRGLTKTINEKDKNLYFVMPSEARNILIPDKKQPKLPGLIFVRSAVWNYKKPDSTKKNFLVQLLEEKVNSRKKIKFTSIDFDLTDLDLPHCRFRLTHLMPETQEVRSEEDYVFIRVPDLVSFPQEESERGFLNISLAYLERDPKSIFANHSVNEDIFNPGPSRSKLDELHRTANLESLVLQNPNLLFAPFEAAAVCSIEIHSSLIEMVRSNSSQLVSQSVEKRDISLSNQLQIVLYKILSSELRSNSTKVVQRLFELRAIPLTEVHFMFSIKDFLSCLSRVKEDSGLLEEIYEVTKKFEQRNFIANGNILVFIFSCLKSLIKERRAFEILKYLIKLMMNSYFAATLIDQLEQPNLENSGHRLVREIGTKVTGIDSSLFFSEKVESLPAYNPKVDATLHLNDSSMFQDQRVAQNDESYQDDLHQFIENLTAKTQTTMM